MRNVNPAFTNPNFWHTYQKLYHQDHTGKGTANWLAQLEQNFKVATVQHTHTQSAKAQQEITINGLVINKIEQELLSCDEHYTKKYDALFKQYYQAFLQDKAYALDQFKDSTQYYDTTYANIVFPLPDDWQLLLQLTVAVEQDAIPDIGLYLIKQSAKHQLGYWDTAHWLPYCLRLEELELLVAYWQKGNSYWQDKGDLAWALLAKFIGFNNAQECEQVLKKYSQILAELQIETLENFFYEAGAIWEQTAQGYEYVMTTTPSYLKNLDHNPDPKYLRLLTYSLRKKEDQRALDPAEEEFPFAAWNAILTKLMA